MATSATLVGYARVSTEDQDPQMQTDALEEAGCARVFVETASGVRDDREELAAALDYLRSGDVLVVWRLDRLGRSLRHLIEVVTDLENRGVGFRSLTEGIDTTTAGGRLVFHIFGALSEFERELVSERTRAGLRAARARGAQIGRPAAMDATDVQAAQAMRTSGMTMQEIADRLGVGRSTLYRYLNQVE